MSSMTRRHFNALAGELNTVYRNVVKGQDGPSGPDVRYVFKAVVDRVTSMCCAENPTFDRDRFKAAVYKED